MAALACLCRHAAQVPLIRMEADVHRSGHANHLHEGEQIPEPPARRHRFSRSRVGAGLYAPGTGLSGVLAPVRPEYLNFGAGTSFANSTLVSRRRDDELGSS
jgi:hypothetical protein